MTPSDDRGLAGSLEEIARELADRLQHPEALLSEPACTSANQALVEERRKDIEVGIADGLGGLQSAAAAEDRESPEEPLLVLVEEVMRPGDRRSQGRVALVGVARAFEQIESRVEAPEQCFGREELRPRGGELDGER